MKNELIGKPMSADIDNAVIASDKGTVVTCQQTSSSAVKQCHNTWLERRTPVGRWKGASPKAHETETWYPLVELQRFHDEAWELRSLKTDISADRQSAARRCTTFSHRAGSC